ncbi:hypothetical protein EVAR_86719_1 [Eumeta japonica]|uniref:Uncharacterized protein n=1 Tax=Eumeta variegata TaxID=151549 RepID=A0A4C1ZJZ8_EUMVA|nr:hypothetical protein EVAR_86719_1 [Eumeta japonica]
MDASRLTKEIYYANVYGRVRRGRPTRTQTDLIEDILKKAEVRSTRNRRACMRIVMSVVKRKSYRRVSPHPGLPLFTMRTLLSIWSADFLRCGGDQMMDSVFFVSDFFIKPSFTRYVCSPKLASSSSSRTARPRSYD